MKIEKKYKNLISAFDKFKEALNFPDDEIHRESLIQRFKYTFELSWKLMQEVLKDQGHETYGVKTIVRTAGKINLIENVDAWISYTNARNNASHIYLEEVAVDVANTAKSGFKDSVEQLLNKTRELYINI